LEKNKGVVVTSAVENAVFLIKRDLFADQLHWFDIKVSQAKS
jgi:hypothetical protein